MIEWNGALTKVKNCIENLNFLITTSESEFLELGNNLFVCSKTAQEINKQSAQITNSFTDERINQALTDLKTAFITINQQISETENYINCVTRSFHKIIELVNDSTEHLKGFDRLIKRLRMFSISTRIESERLGSNGRGFLVISQDIDNLTADIHDKSNLIKNNTKLLTTNLKQTIDFILLNDEKRKNESIIVTDEIVRNIDSISNKYEQAGKDLLIVTEISGKISSSISEIVASLQFHDITRQQIEHIINALNEVIAVIRKISETGKTTQPNNFENEINYLYQILILQSAQIGNSREELIRAIDNVLANLTDVRANSSYSYSQLESLVSSSNKNDKQKQLEQLSDSLYKLPDAMLKIEELTNELKRAIESAGSFLKNLLLLSHQINEISTEIELIAVNASIKSARAGSEGAVLGVLAQSIQMLSVEAKFLIKHIISLLNQVKDNSIDVSSTEKSADNIYQSKTEEITISIKNKVSFFRELNTQTQEEIKFAKNSVEELDNRIDNIQNKITLSQSVTYITDEVLSTLNSITSDLVKEFNLKGIFKNDLDTLKKHYSMDKEREIHNRIISNKTLWNKEEKQKKTKNGENDLGDNVELF